MDMNTCAAAYTLRLILFNATRAHYDDMVSDGVVTAAVTDRFNNARNPLDVVCKDMHAFIVYNHREWLPPQYGEKNPWIGITLTPIGIRYEFKRELLHPVVIPYTVVVPAMDEKRYKISSIQSVMKRELVELVRESDFIPDHIYGELATFKEMHLEYPEGYTGSGNYNISEGLKTARITPRENVIEVLWKDEYAGLNRNFRHFDYTEVLHFAHQSDIYSVVNSGKYRY